MFNMYQKINRHEDKEGKEPDVIGHDRFCQERASRSSKRKKKMPKRAQSVAEFSSLGLSSAGKRNAFRNRSLSSEQKDGPKTPQRCDSFARSFFSRFSSVFCWLFVWNEVVRLVADLPMWAGTSTALCEELTAAARRAAAKRRCTMRLSSRAEISYRPTSGTL